MFRSKNLNALALGAALVVGLFVSPRALSADTPYTWKSVAIGGGGFVSGILFHPTEPGLLYSRTDVGGAYRWDPAGAKWIALNDDLGGLNNEFMQLGVLSFAVDPNDANRLYLACGQYVESWAPTAIVLRSNDRGATWSRTNLTFKLGGNQDGRNTGERLVVDPNKGDILFLGTNQNGLWKSTDRGVTWAQVTSFTPTSCTLVLFDEATGTNGNATPTIYVGVNSTTAASLYRSTDSGATWAAVSGQPAGLMPHHADIGYNGATRALYLAYSNALGPNGASAGAVWKLTLPADTWTNITPVNGGWGYGGLSVDAADPSTVICSTLDRWGPRDEIYRTTNGGASWTGILQSGTLDHAQAPSAAVSSPHWIGDVKIDPFNSARALFNTGYGLFETSNLGAANTVWKFSNEELEETVPQQLISPPSGAPLVSTVGDIDGWRHDALTVEPATRLSPRHGSSWSIDFAENAPAKMVRTFNDGTRGAYSNDGGATWADFAVAATSSTNGGKIAISADGATILWGMANVAAYRSTNSGASWTACTGAPSSTSNTYAPVADRVNASKFYIYNQSTGRVYVSTDSGANFALGASVPTGASPMRSVPGSEGHLWLPAWGSGLRRSTDSGATFTAVGTVQEGYAIGFGKPATGQTYPAIFLWGKVGGVVGFFRSDDNAATWTRINDALHQFGYINWITGDPRTFGRVYLATSGRGVMYGDPTPTVPTITSAPREFHAPVGATATFAVAAGGVAPLTYQWKKDGVALGGATSATLSLTNVSLASAGAYTVTVTNAQGSVTSSAASLVVGTSGGRVPAISMRARVGTGSEILVPGIVVGGSSPQQFLVRALGPKLGDFGIDAATRLGDPLLKITTLDGTVVAQNDDWSTNTNAAAIVTTTTTLGAQPLTAGSKDAVLLTTLAPGIYTPQISGVANTSGVSLVEFYNVDPANKVPAISMRARVGTGSEILVPGLVVEGTAPKMFLIRALGPKLGDFGIDAATRLNDPLLKVTLLDGTVIAQNDNWEENANAALIPSITATLGAQPLTTGSRDAVLLIALPPGIYTPQISGVGATSGVSLVEFYNVE